MQAPIHTLMDERSLSMRKARKRVWAAVESLSSRAWKMKDGELAGDMDSVEISLSAANLLLTISGWRCQDQFILMKRPHKC